MRILGLDYGSKRLGVAVSDPLGITAQPIAVVDSQNAIPELQKIIKEYSPIDEIVVGLPKTLKGEIGPAAQKVLEFVETLKQNFEPKIVTWDERLTTAGVEKDLIAAGLSRKKRKQVIDKSAAAVILRSYMAARRK